MSSEFDFTSQIDAVAPTIVAVRTLNKNTVQVVFSKPVLADEAANVANYSFTGGITVTTAEAKTATMYELTTSDIADDTDYTLTVSNIHDKLGNLI